MHTFCNALHGYRPAGECGVQCNTNTSSEGCRAHSLVGIRMASLAQGVGFNRKKVSRFLFISYYYSKPIAMQMKITEYSITANVQALQTACSGDAVALQAYSRSSTTRSSPRSNEPALTSSRQRGDPVYSRTLVVVAAFSSTFFNGRSRRRPVAETTVVILNCPRLAA